MTHEELKRRIKLMPYEAIMLLTGKEIWKLTDSFDEKLVREIVAKHRTVRGQRAAIKDLKIARGKALIELGRPVTGAPQYFEDWIFDLKTTVLVEPAPTVSNVIKIDNSPFSNSNSKDKAVAVASNVVNDVADKLIELKSRIAELEAENLQLKEANKTLEKQLEEFKCLESAEEIQWHDKVRLELLLRLLENDGTDLQKVVKARVAEVMQAITKLPNSTCKNYCTNRDLNTETHKEEILKLNSKLQAIGISFIL